MFEALENLEKYVVDYVTKMVDHYIGDLDKAERQKEISENLELFYAYLGNEVAGKLNSDELERIKSGDGVKMQEVLNDYSLSKGELDEILNKFKSEVYEHE